MVSLFDLIPQQYEPDILDDELRMRVWHCNMNGFLATELPRPPSRSTASIAEAERYNEEAKRQS